MKKIIIVLVLIVFSSYAKAQEISIRLAKTEIVDIARQIKQDMVLDSIVSAEKNKALKSCEDALKRVNPQQNIQVPIKYLSSILDRFYSDYTQFEYYRINRNKYLRILREIQKTDPSLKILETNNNYLSDDDKAKLIDQLRKNIE